MPNNFKNDVNITGYVFSTNFRTGVSKATAKWHPNEAYISGNLHIATDDEGMNVVPVNFFVYEKREDRKTGQVIPNETYQTLRQLMTCATFETSGTQAPKVRVSGTVDTNDFYSTRSSEVISAQRVNGRFVHIMTPGTKPTPANFQVDIVATSAVEREVEGRAPFVDVRGYAFNYNQTRVYPVRFECQDENGMAFLEGLEASSTNPVSLSVWGDIRTTVIERVPQEQEAVVSGFGTRPVISGNATSTVRSWVITGADTDRIPEFGEVEPLTKSGMKQLIDERNLNLANIKARGEMNNGTASSYPAASPKASASTPAASFSIPSGAEIYDDELPF